MLSITSITSITKLVMCISTSKCSEVEKSSDIYNGIFEEQ